MVRLTLFEVLTLSYYISAAKLKDAKFGLVESGLMFAGDSTRVWEAPLCQIVTHINKQQDLNQNKEIESEIPWIKDIKNDVIKSTK